MSKATNAADSIRAFTVLRQVFWVAKRNIPVFFALFVLSTFTSVFLNELLADMTTGNGTIEFKLPSLTTIALLAKVIFEIMLLKAVLVYSTSQTLSGHTATILEIVSKIRGSEFISPAIKLIIVSLFYLFAGIACLVVGMALPILMVFLTENYVASMILLIVVGLVALIGIIGLTAKYYIVVPIIVIEKTGIIEGFSRSSRLTRGHKWGIARLVLLMLFSVVILSFGVGLLAGTALVTLGGDEVATGKGSIVDLYVIPLVGASVSALFAVLDGFATTVCYELLKTQANEVTEESTAS